MRVEMEMRKVAYWSPRGDAVLYFVNGTLGTFSSGFWILCIVSWCLRIVDGICEEFRLMV